MNTVFNRKQGLYFIILISVIFIGACASAPFKSSGEALRERVNGLMQAKISNDWAAVYGFYTPAFQEKNPKNQFVKITRQMHFTNYTIQSIEIDDSGKTAMVRVRHEFKVHGATFQKTYEQEWVKDDGQWYQKPKIKDIKSLFGLLQLSGNSAFIHTWA